MHRSDTPLHRLLDHGQSYWLDNLTREKLTSGELERRVSEEGLRGVTSNPSIFRKAITGSEAYAEQIASLARDGAGPEDIYEALVLDDIRDACDVLRPVWEESDGVDGYVSLELSPHLAHHTQGSIEDARRLFSAVDRPNLLIKIPGTPAGVPAIEEALYEGINVNVTLLFSISAWRDVAEAHMRALERRLEDGKPIDGIASVASFFLSRIDVAVDRLLGHRIRADDPEARHARLLGKAAIASAKLAYRDFTEILASDRWKRLEAEGASPQRLLWASSSTKDPLYSDVRYVEPLIGPHTINTLPDATIRAFADHGVVATTVEDGIDEAEAALDSLAELGIDLDAVTWDLMNEGVEKFITPFDELLDTLAEERAQAVSHAGMDTDVTPSDARSTTDDVVDHLAIRRFAARMHAGDGFLWSRDPETAEDAAAWLGWLGAPGRFLERLDDLETFAAEVAGEGITDVLHIGMGGSSLAADVSRRVFGHKDGRPRLHVLDDTAPAAIQALHDELDPASTLFVIASKSGTTAETMSHFRSFWAWAEEGLGRDPGDRFVAITDPGTPLARKAGERGFRRTFENPEDVGGRYSALTWFGLVPMALQGVDLEALMDAAMRVRASCGAGVPEQADPGIELGAALGGLARDGRDKVTLVMDAALAPFGDWVEQLLAESTGKDGTGLIPVVGEALAPPEAYGNDRVFVHMRLADEDDAANARALDELRDAGHPVLVIEVDGLEGMGGEFYRWEVATATAGAVLGVNPFDQPNVESAKRRTRELLEGSGKGGVPEELLSEDERLALFAPEGSTLGTDGPAEALATLLRGAREGDYLALLPYMARTDDRMKRIERLRIGLRDRVGIATTVGFGPRYLHSTGQLHKGGPDTGIYVIITMDEDGDVSIPGEDHGFARLHRAQAMADFGALQDEGRRVVRLHLKGDVDGALGHLAHGLALDAATPLVET